MLLEVQTELDLTDIDLSNVNENISNAGKIFNALMDRLTQYLSDSAPNLILSAVLLIVGWKLINTFSKK